MMEGWKIKSIEEIAKTTSGGTPSRTNKSYYNGNILWVKSGDLDDNFISDTEEKITEDAVKNSSAKLFPIGTVLMAMYGATVGKTAILKVPATTNQAVCGIIPNPEECNNEFLRFQLMFKREDFLKQRYGGAQPNISQTIIKNFEILLPPLPEQRKIAYVLSTVQKAIEQQDKLIRTTTELKKALMQKLFTEGIRCLSGAETRQKQTEIGPVPESWEVVELGKVCEKTKLIDPTRYPNEEFIYVDVSSVNNELFKVIEYNKIKGKDAPSRARKLIQTDDVIFATVRPTLKRIAKITEDLNNQVCSTGYCVLKPNKSKLNSEFLYQYLQTDDFIARIEKLQRGASYPAVRDSDVKGVKIPLPKYDEQILIGNYLKTLDQKKSLASSKKQTLTALFKTLLHELMTGQRRVHEIEFEALNAEIKEMSTSM